MKKIALMSALVLALGFTSCDNYEEPNPPAQSNPQESILKASDVTVTNALGGATFNLSELNSTATPIQIANIACSTLPASYTFATNVEISANDFATAVAVPSYLEAGETEGTYAVYVTADDLQGVYYNSISKSPNSKQIKARVGLMTQLGNQTAYVGGPNNFYGDYDLTVVPFPSQVVIEDAYYLLGTINGWDVATAVKLNHSSASPYDDPVFTLAVDITNDQAAEGWWWKIVPQSTYVTGGWVDADNASFGVAENGDHALTGMLVGRTATEDCGAGCINEAGQYLLSIDMLEGTYAFTSAVPYLYTPGDANGWSQAASQMLYTNDFANYYGYAVLAPGGFKFCDAPDWDHTNYGATGNEGTLSNDGGAGNLMVPEKGLYWCHVNTASLTYEVTLVSTIGVIGDATPGGWDNSTALTPSADFLTWTGQVAFGSGEFKFRANNGWDINLGGNLQDLQQDGANLASPGAGTYNVTLNLGQLPYSANLAK